MLKLIFRIFVLQIINTSVSMQEKIIILDFGSQTTQLIGRRSRVECILRNCALQQISPGRCSVKELFFLGSPFSVYDEKCV